MALDRPRVFFDDPQLSSSVPEAPPLPLARSVLGRFRYSVRKPSTQGSPSDPSKDSSIIPAEFAPVSSLSTSHKTGLKLRALDINQTRSHVVLAGVKILKTVRLGDEPSCIEDFNLRTAAVNYAWDSPKGQEVPMRGTSSRAFVSDSASVQRDIFDIEDVAWSNNQFRDHIATAARNGKIMLYDMTRPGVEVGSLHEHFRQVHKVDFNPLEGACLLSGSQDGTVRLWDLRHYRKNAMVCTSMNTFPGRSEGVRHVKWSPRDTWSFAFSTDTGVIQRWDTRQSRSPVLKFSAHHQTCNSIDWHPDGKHLVSGGKDQVVKVWNISPDARGGVVFSLRTPREVQNVRWRPPCLVTNSQEQEIKQCTHFATSYRNFSVLHVWDLRRPFIPFREIHHRVNSGTTDMLWRTKDVLWTVGPEGEFSQTDVAFAPKSVDRRTHSALSCTPDGELTFASKRRASRAWGGPEISQGQEIANRERRPSRATDRLSFSRSPGDDSFDERFLSASMRKKHSRAASIKSNKSFGVTPLSTDEMARLVTTDLKLTMDGYDVFKSGQSSKMGSLPGTSASGIFTYLAQNYKNPSVFSDIDVAYLQNLYASFEQNASCAQRASLYRDSQTWKVVGYQVSRELQKRAQRNRRIRIDRLAAANKTARGLAAPDTANLASPEAGRGGGDHITDKTEAVKVNQPFSNAPTPVARPIEKLSAEGHADKDIDGTIDLPPSLTSDISPKHGHPSVENDVNTFEERTVDTAPISKVHDPFDLREREATMSQWASQPRVPYSLDPPLSQTKAINISRPPLDRETSSDSFMIFSTSSDSQPRHMRGNSFLSISSRSTEHESANEHDRPRFDSSVHSNGSAESKASSGQASQESKLQASDESRESFLDLPTHRNLLVDDFVEHRKKQHHLGDESSESFRSSTAEHSVIDFAVDSTPNNDEPKISPHIPSSKDDGSVSDLRVSWPAGTIHTEDHHFQAVAKAQTFTKQSQNAPQILAIGEGSSASIDFVLLSDYLATKEDESDAGPSALKARNMLKQLFNWYSERGDAQMASHLFLLTAPLLAPPGTSSSADHPLNSILNTSYYEHLTSAPLSISAEVANSILQTFHGPLSILGISPAFVESVLSTYHDQLLAFNLLNPAVDLRRLAYPSFPAVFEQGMKDVHIGTLCLGCNNPINNPVNKMQCESCHERQAECAICLCQDSPFEMPIAKKTNKANNDLSSKPARSQAPEIPRTDSSSSSSSQKTDSTTTTIAATRSSTTPKLHTTCVLCNHSTHTACSIVWFADCASPATGSGGACPVPGCLCDCVRGYYRNQRLQKLDARERQKGTAVTGVSVRRDDWNVGESQAVGRVRGALRGKDAGGAATDGPRRGRGGIAGVLGSHGRAMSDEGKKVRLLEPGSQ